MEKFLENPWVVGIGGGIISGIIVFYISNWMMNKKDSNEYIRKIELANDEVINMLKPYIADVGLPNGKVLDSIISSVARKYKIEINKMFTVKIICEELIREIISNVYVSNDKKNEYTEQLSEHIKKIEETNAKDSKETGFDKISSQQEYRRKLNRQYSILLSMTVMCVTMTMLAVLTISGDMDIYSSKLYSIDNSLMLMTAIIISCMLPLFIIILFRYIKNVKLKSKSTDKNSSIVDDNHKLEEKSNS
ncbi:hypothetical protein [Paraclostridium bifermentans]|uniref:hypothetical protein n=1 Tax=Paraclostridium bifermentans TaxID=1490 RepID=UPI0034DE4412